MTEVRRYELLFVGLGFSIVGEVLLMLLLACGLMIVVRGVAAGAGVGSDRREDHWFFHPHNQCLDNEDPMLEENTNFIPK